MNLTPEAMEFIQRIIPIVVCFFSIRIMSRFARELIRGGNPFSFFESLFERENKPKKNKSKKVDIEKKPVSVGFDMSMQHYFDRK